MAEKLPVLIFDNSSKDDILDALDYTTNTVSELVNNEGKIVTNQDFESITSDNFGGVLKGSKIPIKNNDRDLVEYFTSLIN